MIQSSGEAKWQFQIDRGGTFTDIVANSPDGAMQTRKLFSEKPEAYRDAAVHGIRQFLAVPDAEPMPVGQISCVGMGSPPQNTAERHSQAISICVGFR